MNEKNLYLKYKEKYLKLKGGLSITFGKSSIPDDLRRCAPHRMRQQSGTCWYDAIINIIILTPRLNNNMYTYIDSLPQSDKNIINTELTTFASLNLSYDNPSNRAYQYKLKHLIGALFTLFRNLDLYANITKPNTTQNFSADQAARIKSIGRYGSKHGKEYDLDAELTYLRKKSKPKYFGTAYDPYTGMCILLQYFNLNNDNDVIIIKDSIIDPLTKQLKLNISSDEITNNRNALYKKEIRLHNNYSLEAVCYDKYFGFHASAGVRCKTDNTKFITYDSNNILKYEDWYETQKNHIFFSVYVAK